MQFYVLFGGQAEFNVMPKTMFAVFPLSSLTTRTRDERSLTSCLGHWLLFNVLQPGRAQFNVMPRTLSQFNVMPRSMFPVSPLGSLTSSTQDERSLTSCPGHWLQFNYVLLPG